MSLFSTPMILVDADSANRTYNWLKQVPGQDSGLYTETAAAASAESLIKSAHSETKAGRKRHLVQFSINEDLVDPGADDPTSDPIVVNITVQHHPKHAAGDIDNVVACAADAMGETDFTTLLIRGEI